MDENIKSSYYSILPAVVRYDKDLTDKAKLLYSEITCLCNKEGYCFATNNYQRKIYLTDALGYEKAFTPPHKNNFTWRYEKNFTNNNIKYNMDDLFI